MRSGRIIESKVAISMFSTIRYSLLVVFFLVVGGSAAVTSPKHYVGFCNTIP